MKIKSLNNHVVLKIQKVEEKKSAIYSGKEEPRIKYILVSPEKTEVQTAINEKFIELSAGDSILFEKEKGHINGDFVLVKKEHIIGVVEEE